MDPVTLATAWAVFGLLLLAAEVILPGGVAFASGLAAVLNVVPVLTGFYSGIWASISGWVVLSVILTLVTVWVLSKYFKSDSSYHMTDEDLEAVGDRVQVVETVYPEQVAEQKAPGRIRYRGTTWKAVSDHKVIEKGSSAKILRRDNIKWVIEPDE